MLDKLGKLYNSVREGLVEAAAGKGPKCRQPTVLLRNLESSHSSLKITGLLSRKTENTN